jgi:3-oxoacyl-[acyl-carrier protein] reductase
MSNIAWNFTGRSIIVTGGAVGIGRALAEGFAQAGAASYAFDLGERPTDLPEGIRFVHCDVTDSSSVDAAVGQVVAETGRVDVVVNNAGILRDGVLWKTSDEDFDLVLAVHAGGTFRTIRACSPIFRAQQFGRVINITSYTGLHGNIGQANYATAKAGIIGLTRTAAKELGRFGVTVNAISPNAETRMVASIPPAKRAELEGLIPLGRFAAPTEMFPAIAFLASEEAGYVTGVVLPVDGGLSI